MPKGRLPGEYSGLFPPEIRQFIAENYIGIGPKGMAELLNNTFGTNYTKEQLKSYYGNHKLNSGLTGYFKKGHAPWNKGKKGVVTGGKQTQFKKGHIPHNYVPIGTETVDSDGYIKVKIAEPNAWEYKHRLIWEKHHGRKIPPGHAVIFADGNNRNFEPDNLLLVSRAQLVRMNQRGLIKNDAELTKTGIILADIYNRMGELKRKHNIKSHKFESI
ncbi:hypothetical protein CSTERTH_01010 [Thermoclostridium stercorarium subsp. thermolacticum DSM 2910]|uniref:HNH nuclease domain-containing protein n=2 Tax=Thermoclostridium stercorarium TaxID=1510 RepID=A0A1B1YGR6_THEST|nr:hypothetical protein CSTERTH_01010 [Thermoclostridium stercorarium subsp. thermolacticum DSM 2910]